MATRSSFHGLNVCRSAAPGVKNSHARRNEFRRHLGVEHTKEFLFDIKGRRTRWPLLIVISLIAVCLLAYSTSRVLFEKARPAATSGDQIESTPSTIEADTSDDAAQAVEVGAVMQSPADVDKARKAFAFSFQSEAEAATDDRLLEPGEHAAPGSTIDKQVHEVLKAASDAVRNENLDSFLELLDESDESFFRTQKIKAQVAFRQFDEIDGTYSDVKIKVLNENELAVNLHCKVDAAFAKSGRSIVLFNGDQNITLRKAAGAVWKICAID